MKGQLDKNQENFDKCLLMSINKRKNFLDSDILPNKKIPLECCFPNCKKTYEIKSRLMAHLRTHVN